ncbi:MAG: hypothetical protein J7L07_04225, partial [Candidatus Odinarchaeota archaeon]|nr:hypothetical protein [Candidatus Odinarchaeota archaeon]
FPRFSSYYDEILKKVKESEKINIELNTLIKKILVKLQLYIEKYNIYKANREISPLLENLKSLQNNLTVEESNLTQVIETVNKASKTIIEIEERIPLSPEDRKILESLHQIFGGNKGLVSEVTFKQLKNLTGLETGKLLESLFKLEAKGFLKIEISIG